MFTDSKQHAKGSPALPTVGRGGAGRGMPTSPGRGQVAPQVQMPL